MNEAIEDYSSGKIDIARVKFEKLILIDGKNLDLLYNYGRILGDLEEYEKEQRIYFRILEQNPNDLETLINLSISLNATKNFN